MPREQHKPGRRLGLEVGGHRAEKRSVYVCVADQIKYVGQDGNETPPPSTPPTPGGLNYPGMRRAAVGRAPLWAYGRLWLSSLADCTLRAWVQRVNSYPDSRKQEGRAAVWEPIEEGDTLRVIAYALQTRARLRDLFVVGESREQVARRARALVRHADATLAGQPTGGDDEAKALDLRKRAHCLLASLYLAQVREDMGEGAEGGEPEPEPTPSGMRWSEPHVVGDELRTFTTLGDSLLEVLWSEPEQTWRAIVVAWSIDAEFKAPDPLRPGSPDLHAVENAQRRALAVVHDVCASRLERLRGESEGA